MELDDVQTLPVPAHGGAFDERALAFDGGGERLYGKLGFNISYKYQSSYYSQTFLVNGTVKSYGNTDAQVNYDLFKHKLNLKIGGSNVFNKYYYSYLGGPSIGAFYYTTFTYSM